MRRSSQDETMHGTANGQLPIDGDLVSTYSLSERQAVCATLLRYGVSPHDLAARIGIADSTLEKHLSALRTKIGVATTQALIAALQAKEADDNIEAYHSWPPTPMILGGYYKTAASKSLHEALRGRLHLTDILAGLRDHLAPNFGAKYIFYSFIPLSVPGLLKGDTIDIILAPDEIVTAYREGGQPLDYPTVQKLFAKPDGIAFIDDKSSDYDTANSGVQHFYDQCLADGVRYGVSFGFPAGGAYVGMSISLAESAKNVSKLIELHGEDMRYAAMLMHSHAWAYGALAAHFGLTIRERDALSALACGHKIAEAAQHMKISDRAFAKLLSGARGKLNAKTNGEAVYKATAINALVFR